LSSVGGKSAILLGNIFEHYDTALFGFLAPFLAPLFFRESDPITALILTYAILPVGLLARPIASLFFGRLCDTQGVKKSLQLSLFGMLVTTLAFAFLPTYREVGYIAPLLLALLRILQSFFATGEKISATLLFLETADHSKRPFLSSLLDSSTLIGITLASFAVTIVSYRKTVDVEWRHLYIIGALMSLFAFWRISQISYSTVSLKAKTTAFSLKTLLTHKKQLLSCACISGFSYAIYNVSFTFFNGIASLVTTISPEDIFFSNSCLLALDMLLLPFFGKLISLKGYKIERLMQNACLLTACLTLPLFCLLPACNLFFLGTIRLIFVLLGTSFAAPYHALIYNILPQENRSILYSLSTTLGSQLIGAPTAFLSLWLFKITHQSASCGIYLTVCSLLAFLALRAVRSQVVK
jgi:MFS transporter, MHS family, proline/betaine transporter